MIIDSYISDSRSVVIASQILSDNPPWLGDLLRCLLIRAIDDRKRELAHQVEKAVTEKTVAHPIKIVEQESDESQEEREERLRYQRKQRAERAERAGQDTRFDELIAQIPNSASDWQELRDTAYEKAYGRKSFHAIVKEFEESVRLRVTNELLATSFALYDGTTTTWGEATAVQHVARAEKLENQAEGFVVTAARHRAAADMIQRASVASLSQLQVAA